MRDVSMQSELSTCQEALPIDHYRSRAAKEEPESDSSGPKAHSAVASKKSIHQNKIRIKEVRFSSSKRMRTRTRTSQTSPILVGPIRMCHSIWKRRVTRNSKLVFLVVIATFLRLSLADEQILLNYPETLRKNASEDEHGISVPFSPMRMTASKREEVFAQDDGLRWPSERLHESLRLSKRQSLAALPGAAPPEDSAKFIRTNELDAFLDDMDHNELRNVANGVPIGPHSLFRSKELEPAELPRESHQNQFDQHRQAQQQKEPADSKLVGIQTPVMEAPLPAAPEQTQRLEEGASERQIYSDCALILQRTYVKNVDHQKHQLVPFGKTEQACISYKHIDKAVEQAKHNLKFRDLSKLRKRQHSPMRLGPNGQPVSPRPLPPFEIIHQTLEPPEDLIALIGEINMAATKIIADQFDLSNDELLNGLPLIDMSKTKFWSMCPLLVRQDIKCELGRFRTFTGHCNNLKHPTWGAAMTPFARYLPPVHPDGISVPRKSVVSEVELDLGGHEVGGHETNPSMPAASLAGDFFESDNFHEINRRAPDRESASGRGESHLASGSSVRLLVEREQRLNSISEQEEFERRLQPAAGLGEEQEILASHQQQQHAGRPKSVAAELPSARLVTSIVHRDVDIPAHDFSILFMSWGQMLDHDMTRAAQSPSSIKCCEQANGQPKHKLCLPIEVPPNDPLYSKFNVRCLEFRRSLAGVRANCVLGPRVHQNAITSPIDANFVYGSSQAQADSLRLFKGGRLRDRDWFRQEGLKPLLPAQEVEPDLDCIARPRDLFCFLAGDVRANEQTHLTVLHTLYMREHNRIADRLSELNPHWDDERTFQETRHIIAAGVQQVMLNEYIPLLIGKKMSELYNLTASAHNQKHYWHGYDPTVTTSVSNSFAAAAFRQGHTFVQGTVERYNKYHEFVASERLRHLFKQPFLLYKPGVLDELVGGMINQLSQSYDPFVSEEISGHLFQAPEAKIGHDLPAINLQRGREQGLPGYNLFREWCGLPRAETFKQLEPYLTNHTAYHYSRLYKHVDDIDLWSGGVSERKLPGAAIGPTFACIIARQFSNTRRGDRFWFENPNLPSSFTPEQLAEIRKVTLAKILCANADHLPTIQRWALRSPHPVLNPRLACEELPEIELQYWQEE